MDLYGQFRDFVVPVEVMADDVEKSEESEEKVDKEKNNEEVNLVIVLESKDSELIVDAEGDFSMKALGGENIHVSLPAYLFDSIPQVDGNLILKVKGRTITIEDFFDADVIAFDEPSISFNSSFQIPANSEFFELSNDVSVYRSSLNYDVLNRRIYDETNYDTD